MKRILSFLLAVVLILGLFTMVVPEASAASVTKTSENCIALIKKFEGFSAKPFYDYNQYSIGYGTSCKYDDYPNGITQEKADELLRAELAVLELKLTEFASRNGLKLSQQQFDALISFTYNLGSNWMNNTSTFRTAVLDGSKGNDFIFAITMWCNAGGNIMPGLVERRLAEANLYLNGIYSDKAPSNYSYVIFDNNMDSAVATVKIQGYDMTQPDQLRAIPSKAGYRFLGWYTKDVGGEWISSTGSGVQDVLYAHWMEIMADSSVGVAAEYVRYAGKNQKVYPVPAGIEMSVLEENTKLNIVADYMDNNGVKWGRLSQGGWVNLTDVKHTASETTGQAVNLKVTVNANGVNIRKGPGTSYPKNGTVNKGQQLQLTRVQQGGMYLWGQFSEGWICLDYTDYTTVSKENSESANRVTATGVINTEKLNIRSRPSASSDKVGQYSKGEKVQITLQQNVGNTTWGKTDKGWISLYYVKVTPVVDAEATQPTEPAPTEPAPTEPTPTEPAPTEPAPTEPTPTEPTQPESNKVIATGTVYNCTTLRIRGGAGTKYTNVGSLNAGAQINIYEMVTVGSQVWGRIDKGWVCMDYVRLNSSGSTTTTGKTGKVVNCTNLNVRAGAGTSYARVGKLVNGTKVEILETTTVGKVLWGRIKEGWVSMEYIKMDSASSDSGTTDKPEATTPTQPDNKEESGSVSTTEKVNKTGVITGTNTLRVRSAPGTNSKEVGTLKKGDRVVIIETTQYGNATWGRTEIGWVHMYYVKLDTTQLPEGSVIRTVNTSSLRIRAGAGTSYEAVGSYIRGAQVIITAQTVVGNTVWGRTDKGWISLDYVK